MSAKVLIINADDLGYDPAVSRGILRAMREGVVTSATLIVNGPHSAQAAAAAEGLSLGLHLNLARWAPCSSSFPAPLLEQGALCEQRAGELPPEVVEQEALAQLDRLRALLGRDATHLDVHKHLHLHPLVLEGVIQAARARGLPVRSVDAPMRQALRERGVPTCDHFIGEAGAEAFWTLQRLQAHLGALGEGTTELMCHPGYAPEAVRSGYSAQREVELQTFLDPRARALLTSAGAQVADYRAVH